jgi:organic hydroperoxide reductase OsmC/OhrA
MRDQRSRQHINPPQRKGKSMQHAYTSHITWTGNQGTGTSGYKAYARTWDIAVKGKEPIHCSNDPLLGGDPGKMNPEDLLLSSLSACHMLWYLHLASDAGITVMEYQDSPVATGEVLKGARVALFLPPSGRKSPYYQVPISTPPRPFISRSITSVLSPVRSISRSVTSLNLLSLTQSNAFLKGNPVRRDGG